MNTKAKGDIAEQAAILNALQYGWGVAKPVGDRFPYDLIFDIKGVLVKIQVKHTWFDLASGNYVLDTRRTKTNRRVMVRDRYQSSDFDFALAYIADVNLFYVLPIDIFNSYRSAIHFVEVEKQQQKPRSVVYRNAWHLISQWATHRGTDVGSPVKFGEASDEVIPSQESELFRTKV